MAQLRHRKAQLDALNTRVVVLGFVGDDRMDTWLQETKSPFPVLLDNDRAVYRAYGLSRSLWRVVQPHVLTYYARQVLAGEKLRGGQGDPLQLGGNFIVDRTGVIRLAYYSDDPTDRPPLDTLFDTLHAL